MGHPGHESDGKGERGLPFFHFQWLIAAENGGRRSTHGEHRLAVQADRRFLHHA